MKKKGIVIIVVAILSVASIYGITKRIEEKFTYEENCKELSNKREELEKYKGKIAINDKSVLGVTKQGESRVCSTAKNSEEAKSWKNIEKVSMAYQDMYSITKDHKVQICETEDKDYDQELMKEVESWSNVKEVVGTIFGVAGVDYNGNFLYAVSKRYEKFLEEKSYRKDDLDQLKTWKDIKTIQSGVRGVMAVTNSGEIRLFTELYCPQRFKLWRYIVKADFSFSTVVGLREDGTVEIETYEREMEQIVHTVKSWKDIVDVQVDGSDKEYVIIMGLKKDGTIVSTGGRAPDTSKLHNVKAFDLDDSKAVFLFEDGTVKTMQRGNEKSPETEEGSVDEELSTWNLLN